MSINVNSTTTIPIDSAPSISAPGPSIPLDPASTSPLPRSGKTAAHRQIRGSSLLLAGRLINKVVNFLSQVLIVRCLSQSDYGALAYALAFVALGQSLATFGLDRAISRFLPIYHERKQYDKMFGTLLMVVGAILSIGLAMALLLFAFQGYVGGAWIKDSQALSLLMMLIFLAPVQAIDSLLVGVFAAFSSPRAIFFRKNVLAPSLKLAVVIVFVVMQGDVFFLAGGYFFAGILGVAICAAMLVRLMKQQELFQHFHWRQIEMPWREVLAFTVPLLTSDLVYIVMHSMDAIMLEHYGSVEDVAALRAVQPLAMFNQLVMASFATLFVPMAARMFARDDRQGINDLYWQTAVWIAVFSFPIFVVTFSIAKPITVLLYGARYEDSAAILSILALGCYFHAALGFNGLTLKVYGKLRYIVSLNVAAALVNFGLILWLIPRYGALGAAIGTTATLFLHNIFKQMGLLGTGINFFEWRYLKVYLNIGLSASVLLVVQQAFSPHVAVSIALAALASLWVVRTNRRLLAAHEIFPEVMRLPLVRRIVGQ